DLHGDPRLPGRPDRIDGLPERNLLSPVRLRGAWTARQLGRPPSVEDAARLLQLVVNGAAAGCIYGLIALGFVLIYKATEMVNFAQGDIMMLGGFVAYSA